MTDIFPFELTKEVGPNGRRFIGTRYWTRLYAYGSHRATGRARVSAVRCGVLVGCFALAASHRSPDPPQVLATLPSESGGIFLFDPDDVELGTEIRLDAPNIRVDRAERRRVIRELQDRLPRPPVVGGTWEDLYRFWPEHLPVGLDVVVAPGDAVWVERATGPTARAVDVYDGELGNRGTGTLPFDRLPIGFGDRCAYVVTSEPAGEAVSELPFCAGVLAMIHPPAGHPLQQADGTVARHRG